MCFLGFVFWYDLELCLDTYSISAQILPCEIIVALLDLGRCVLEAGPRE